MGKERTITIRKDTAKLLDSIKSVLTDERYGSRNKKLYTDENVLHIILKHFYDDLSKAALKSGIKLP